MTVEHLVVALAKEARLSGRRGQNQQGIDVVAFFADAAPTVYQAKRYRTFTAAHLRAAIHHYAQGRRPFAAERMVVVTTAPVEDTAVDAELHSLRGKYPDLAIELWGQKQLSDLLNPRPELVERFFGEATRRLFCRAPVPQEQPDLAVGSAALTEYVTKAVEYWSLNLREHVPLTLSATADEPFRV
ncbi:hypothetical protein [Streptomyces sp. NPDC096311]|uniref:hypothetical protein n=1 Tax=Streptomyces sp. NPDC096311 TaxID=3366083 RepID=UPI0037F90A0B